jgi:hypothetical protein
MSTMVERGQSLGRLTVMPIWAAAGLVFGYWALIPYPNQTSFFDAAHSAEVDRYLDMAQVVHYSALVVLVAGAAITFLAGRSSWTRPAQVVIAALVVVGAVLANGTMDNQVGSSRSVPLCAWQITAVIGVAGLGLSVFAYRERPANAGALMTAYAIAFWAVPSSYFFAWWIARGYA